MLDTFTCAMVRASLRSGRCPVSPEQLSNGVGIRIKATIHYHLNAAYGGLSPAQIKH